ncbi:hypothetical protein [Streptomyces sp.]|uniref:hypothetical protein n=1 Tax=Streptomyces sp. TaxID=1931 RepID=UPI002F91E97F
MIKVDASEVGLFADQLKGLPKALQRTLRPKIKAAASEVAQEIRSQASWSSRIPGAVRQRTSFGGGKRGGVQISVDARKAPHARVHEFPNRGAMIRHRVFGRDTWVEQPARPFFFRAVRNKEAAVVAKVQAAIDEALRTL